jgi:putative NADH-flavin reductase
MKLLVLGASGGTGKLLVEQALASSHIVTAFVRDPAKLALTNPNLTVVRGDARQEPDLLTALSGQDVVVSALGSRRAGDDLAVRSTLGLIAAMPKAGVKRLVLLSSYLATPNYHAAGLMGMLVNGMMKGIVEDKQAGERELKGSELDWTLVYATRLTNGAATGQSHILSDGESVGMANTISRADVATFLLKAVANPTLVRASVIISST